MSTGHVDIIDRGVEKAHVWLNGLAVALDTEDRQYAYRVLRAFLHSVRDHLPPEEAAQLSAQLPIFIRGIYYESYRPSRTPEHARDRESFLTRIAREAVLGGSTEASFAVDSPEDSPVLAAAPTKAPGPSISTRASISRASSDSRERAPNIWSE